MKRLLLIGVVAGGVLVVGVTPADATCSGPRLEYETGPVVRGETVTVTGAAYGDNCYDTGPPPAGEGVLGDPLEEIEVLIVQDDQRIVVARGAANDDYEFEVEVTVPLILHPGEAEMVVEAEDGIVTSDGPILISDDPPAGQDQPVTLFAGRGEGEPTTGSSESGGVPAALIAAAVLLVIGLAFGTVRWVGRP